MDNRILKVSNNSLLQAKKYASERNYGRSFAHYLVYLELCKENRKAIEDEFIDILLKWLEILKLHQRNEDILTCLQNAIGYFPVNCIILTITARYLMEWNQYKDAIKFVATILNENENYLPAIKLRNYINNVLVERWHIRMLNDQVRNESFHKAILQKISQGYNNILDIGTGTGLLSLYAAKSKNHSVKQITACDSSDIMIELTREIINANYCSAVVNLIQQRSTDLNEKFNLIVTEIFDSGVFGEGAIETLVHALDNLLDPTGKIIPANVEIYISGVQCNELARKHSVFTNDINFLNFGSINIVNVDNEPYETEDLFCFNNCKYISNIILPWVIDFNNVTQLKQLLNGETFPVQLKCKTGGVVNAFVLWFKLNLDNGISIDNRPCDKNRNCCWEQAIFYLDEPYHVVSGHNIQISLVYKDGKLKIIPNKLNKLKNTYRVPSSVVKFLNDNQLLEIISKISIDLSVKYKNISINILDLNQFPFLGLLLLKNKTFSILTCCVTNDVQVVIKKLCDINKIQYGSIIFIESIINFDQSCDQYDVIFVNILESEGELSQNNLLHVPMLQQYLLKPDGIFLPTCVALHGSVVECDWFKRVAHVDNANVHNFRIAEFISKYENDEQLDFNLRHLNYKNLTEPCELAYIDLDKSKDDLVYKNMDINVKNDGKANAICYWFEFNLLEYKYNTGPENHNSYVNNAAFILNPELNLKKNDELLFQIIEHNGLLKISVKC